MRWRSEIASSLHHVKVDVLDVYRRAMWVRSKTSRVDPGAFDPKQTPVYCLECGQPLGDALEGECEHCHASYERGRQLVRNYIVCEPVKRSIRSRVGYWLLVLSGLLLFTSVSIMLLLCVMYLRRTEAEVVDNFERHDMYLYSQSSIPVVVCIAFCAAILFIFSILGIYRTPAMKHPVAYRIINEWLEANRPWRQ